MTLTMSDNLDSFNQKPPYYDANHKKSCLCPRYIYTMPPPLNYGGVEPKIDPKVFPWFSAE